MTIPQLPPEAEQEYYKKISKIESGDNPKAKNPLSSASGRFQFIKSTWTGLGYPWAKVFDDKMQWEAIEKFTRKNAEQLIAAGCAVNHATLYGSHFLGVAGFLRVMRGMPDASITTVTSEAQRRANPSILGATINSGAATRPRTIKDFTDWLKRKTGDDYTKRYTAGGWVSGPDVEVPPEDQPIIVEPYIPPRKSNFAALSFFGLVVVSAIAIYFIFFHRG